MNDTERVAAASAAVKAALMIEATYRNHLKASGSLTTRFVYEEHAHRERIRNATLIYIATTGGRI